MATDEEVRRVLATMTPEPVETQVVARLGQENFVGNPAFIDGQWVHPPSPGTHVPHNPATYARKWPGDEPPYESPVVNEPIMRATVCPIDVVATRTGTIKSLSVAMPSPPDGHAPVLAAGAKAAIKRLLVLEAKAHKTDEDIDVVVTYARGYAINAKGEMVAKAIWEKNVPDENDARTRIQTGHEPPAPVDSWLVRGIWRDANVLGGISRIVGGWWADGKPDMFQIWTPGAGLRLLPDVTTWSKEIDGYA